LLTSSEVTRTLGFTLLALRNGGSVEGFVHCKPKGSTLLGVLCVPISVNSVLIRPYLRRSRPC
jgi:hypothetical protein